MTFVENVDVGSSDLCYGAFLLPEHNSKEAGRVQSRREGKPDLTCEVVVVTFLGLDLRVQLDRITKEESCLQSSQFAQTVKT